MGARGKGDVGRGVKLCMSENVHCTNQHRKQKDDLFCISSGGTMYVYSAELLEQSMGASLGTELSYRPTGYIGWRNRFLGIDSWAP